MNLREIMSTDVRRVGPETTLAEAAQLMRKHDVGALPVCDRERLVGLLTDRDLALRAVAEGKNPLLTRVREVMSGHVVHALDDQTVEEAVRLMEEHQIRRLPVLDHARRLVGIVSIADLALHAQPAFSGEVLKGLSHPAHG